MDKLKALCVLSFLPYVSNYAIEVCVPIPIEAVGTEGEFIKKAKVLGDVVSNVLCDAEGKICKELGNEHFFQGRKITLLACAVGVNTECGIGYTPQGIAGNGLCVKNLRDPEMTSVCIRFTVCYLDTSKNALGAEYQDSKLQEKVQGVIDANYGKIMDKYEKIARQMSRPQQRIESNSIQR